MQIKELTLYNFRIYKGLNKLDLTTSDKKNIIIVSGKNGYGKTTFLMSLVWCLYGKNMGEVDSFYRQQINNYGKYEKYIVNSLNRLAKIEGENKFFVSLTFVDVDIQQVPCKEIKIKRTYDVDGGNPETLEILFDGTKNELIEEYGLEYFIRDFIIPLESAKFFFFDAEKIVSLAEATELEQMRELSRAYSEVLGIKKYEDLITNLDDVQLRFKKESATKEEAKKLIELQGKEKQNNIDLTDSENRKKEISERIIELQQQLRSIQEALIKQSNTITSEELDRLHLRSDEVEKDLTDYRQKLNDLLDLAPFAIAGDMLVQVNDQVNNEINSKNVQFKEYEVNEKTEQVLDELDQIRVSQSVAIQQKVQDFYNATFRNLIKKHFFDIDSESLNNIMKLHDFTEVEQVELHTMLGNLKNSFKVQFKSITKDYNSLLAERNAIVKKLTDAESKEEDELIKHYRLQKSKIETEISNKDLEKEELIKAIVRIENEQNQIKSQISQLAKKINTAEMYRDKDELAHTVTNEIKDFIKQFKEEKKKSLEERILNGLDTLMHKKIIKKVKVDMIDQHIDISLVNNRGEEIPKESLSMGEKQLYATALLKALVEESNIDFPVFVDSPMQKFDEDHAENIIDHFYPFISNQVVIFPILKKELTSDEYDKLKKNISKCYLINNSSQDISEFLEVGADKLFETYNKMYHEH